MQMDEDILGILPVTVDDADAQRNDFVHGGGGLQPSAKPSWGCPTRTPPQRWCGELFFLTMHYHGHRCEPQQRGIVCTLIALRVMLSDTCVYPTSNGNRCHTTDATVLSVIRSGVAPVPMNKPGWETEIGRPGQLLRRASDGGWARWSISVLANSGSRWGRRDSIMLSRRP